MEQNRHDHLDALSILARLREHELRAAELHALAFRPPVAPSVSAAKAPAARRPRHTKAPVQRSARAVALDRDGGCLRCRRQDALTLHHVVHRASGGANLASNLQVLCRACHDRVHAFLALPSGVPWSAEVDGGRHPLAPAPRQSFGSASVRRAFQAGRREADAAYEAWARGEEVV